MPLCFEARETFRALETSGLRAAVPLSYGTIGEDTRSFVLNKLGECTRAICPV